MKIKTFIIAIISCLSALLLFIGIINAQSDSLILQSEIKKENFRLAIVETNSINNDTLQTVSNFKRHSIYAELLGSSIYYSVNYDYLLRIYKDNIKLAVGAGIGYISLFIGAGPQRNLLRAFYFTPEANFLFGKKSHYFETGVAFMTGIFHGKCVHVHFCPSGRVGYRYQPQKGGFLFRIGYTPVFNMDLFGCCLFGASFGYIF